MKFMYKKKYGIYKNLDQIKFSCNRPLRNFVQTHHSKLDSISHYHQLKKESFQFQLKKLENDERWNKKI